MTGLDLSAADDAGYRAWREARRGARYTPEEFEGTYSRVEAAWVRNAVAAAAPLIEAAVREQIDAAIRTERMRIKGRYIDVEITDLYDRGHLYGLSVAAHIAARGESS